MPLRGNFTNDNLFYSRRIGGAPWMPEVSDSEAVEIRPHHDPRRGQAFRKTSRGLSIGILESLTAEERARIARIDFSNGVAKNAKRQ